MKSFFVFAISFLLLFLIIQVISGMFLTLTYAPDISEAWEASAALSNETVINRGYDHSLLTLLIAFISASLAYLISYKVPWAKKTTK
ncbi:hypothetical protein ACTWQB_00770 [Piscibacillus sp. B03]|uniref:hypothetical protein n=1 Tax=Piscibacillus sp. B03 TaxID=3457430 RepID=UPI003FCDC739